jgi:hypothetical protein
LLARKVQKPKVRRRLRVEPVQRLAAIGDQRARLRPGQRRAAEDALPLRGQHLFAFIVERLAQHCVRGERDRVGRAGVVPVQLRMDAANRGEMGAAERVVAARHVHQRFVRSGVGKQQRGAGMAGAQRTATGERGQVDRPLVGRRGQRIARDTGQSSGAPEGDGQFARCRKTGTAEAVLDGGGHEWQIPFA